MVLGPPSGMKQKVCYIDDVISDFFFELEPEVSDLLPQRVKNSIFALAEVLYLFNFTNKNLVLNVCNIKNRHESN